MADTLSLSLQQKRALDAALTAVSEMVGPDLSVSIVVRDPRHPWQYATRTTEDDVVQVSVTVRR